MKKLLVSLFIIMSANQNLLSLDNSYSHSIGFNTGLYSIMPYNPYGMLFVFYYEIQPFESNTVGFGLNYGKSIDNRFSAYGLTFNLHFSDNVKFWFEPAALLDKEFEDEPVDFLPRRKYTKSYILLKIGASYEFKLNGFYMGPILNIGTTENLLWFNFGVNFCLKG